MVPWVPLATVPRPLGQQNTLNSPFRDLIEESPSGSAGSPCLPHLPGTTEVNNASFRGGDHLTFAPAAFETERVGESESE